MPYLCDLSHIISICIKTCNMCPPYVVLTEYTQENRDRVNYWKNAW